MAIRLRYKSHDLELAEGQFVVGRSEDCQLSLDDPLVSRRHAMLTVVGASAEVQDLGSRNGVLVNGRRIERATPLRAGDRIDIGGQSMVIYGIETLADSRRAHRQAVTMVGPMESLGESGLPDLSHDEDETATEHPTKMNDIGELAAPDSRTRGLAVLGAMADKSLALNRADHAAKLLDRPLQGLLKDAQEGIPARLAETAARYALRLAQATGDGAWLSYVFDLYAISGDIVPSTIIDELYRVGRKVKTDTKSIRLYIEVIAEQEPTMGPAEKFLLQRIRGLLPLLGAG